MANVLCGRARLVSYLPCLHVLVRSVAVARTGPAAEAVDSDKLQVIISPSEPGPLTDPNESLGPFGPQDQRFPLPGKVGFDCLPEQKKTPVHQKMFPAVLSGRSSSETQKPLIKQLMGDFCEGDDPVTPQNVTRAERYFDDSSVECAVQLCPELLKKDFQSMFPEAPPTAMMVVTVTQRTQNEMTSWSAEVEQEREQMLDRFVEGAKEICFVLQREGFWADFIEPSSGLAFFGSYTNNTLFETDDRYRHLGFQIEDLGCCRVVRHALWGTRVFVGSIFTDAPPDGRVMATLHGNGRSCQNST